MKSKRKKARMNEMPKVLGHGQGLTSMVRKGEWQLAKETHKVLPVVKKHKRSDNWKKNTIPEDMRLEIAKEMAGGATKEFVANKYGVSNSLVVRAMNQVWIGSAVGREILKNVILENGIAMGMQARDKMSELSPMQSVMATGIMSSKFVELDKHTSSTPQEVDFNQLQEIGEHLKQVADSLGVPPEEMDADEENFIDV